MTGGIRYALFCALVGVLTAGTVQADELSSDWRTVHVPWVCRETVRTTIPDNADLTVRFNLKTGQTASADLDKVLADARNFPGVDYFACFQNFSDSISFSAWAWCDAQPSKSDLCLSRESLDNKLDTFFDAFSSYGAFVLKHGGVTPFEPGQIEQSPLTGALAQQRELAITTLCKFYGAEYLDGSFLKNELPALLKKSTCDPAELSHDFTRELLKTDLPQEACERVPQRCAQRRASIRQTIDLLSKAGLRNYVGTAGDYAPPKPECVLDEGLDRRLSELLVRIDRLAGCVKQVENDQGEIIGLKDRFTGTGLDAHYKLRRLSDEILTEDYQNDQDEVVKAGAKVPVYEASVKFYFHPVGSDVSTPELQAAMAAHTRECFNSEPTKSALRGPHGEHLTLKLVDPQPDLTKQDPSEPLIHSISVSKGFDRQYSDEWRPDISCDSLLHETMHVLGLVDEYVETTLGSYFRPDGKNTTLKSWYDCRTIGPINSMMSDHMRAFSSLEPSYAVTLCGCQNFYEAKNPAKNCKQLIAGMKPGTTTCPKGALLNVLNWQGEAASELLSVGQMYGGSRVLDLVRKRPDRSSLLYPAEFRAITQPGCVEENKIFFQCAREAYKTSREHLSASGCGVGLPKECKSGGLDWMR